MKNIKLKQTKLCFIILTVPILLPVALFILTASLADCAPENSLLQYSPFIVIAATVAAAVFLYRRFVSEWFVLLVAVSSIGKWKKDRQFYFTEVNGRTATEAADLIKYRMNHYAKELNVQNKSECLSGAYKKRRHLWSADSSGFEDYYVLYETQTLTNDFCSNAVTESKSIMRKYAEKGIYPFLQTRKERKQPVTRACALVIICNSVANFNAVDYVRKNFSKGHTGFAVCIYEAGTGRYFINGSALGDVGPFAENGEERAMNQIKKAVFCNKFGLNENSYYMPTDSLPYSPETTLYEVFMKIKKELKTSEYESRKIAKSLKDGEIYFDGDAVFYKKGERTLNYSVLDEDECEGEEKSDKKTVLIDRSWSYPKSAKMSKKDYDEALIKIGEYLKFNGIDFEFKNFEQWREEK